MSDRWPPVPLSSEVKLLSGGTPKKSVSRYWGGEIPWVSSGEMSQSHIFDTEHHVTDEGAETGTRLVPAGTVLVVVRGMSLAKEFRVSLTQRPMTFNQDLKALQPSRKVNPVFLYYYLRSQARAIRDSATEASHGTKKLETRVIEEWPLPVPNLPEQMAVVNVISAYDDLIENNRRRIRLLEEAARLLSKEWFVHLRFPGHEHVKTTNGVPEGWEKKTLGEVAPLHYGKGLKQADRVPGPFRVYGSSGIVGMHEKPLVFGPTIIIGRKGNVGSVYWSTSDCFPIDTVYYISSEQCSPYLFYALKEIQFINTDVAVPGLNRNFAHSRQLLVPETKILTLFHQHVEVIHSQLDRLTSCNKALADARDLLLPRLMNGEIAV